MATWVNYQVDDNLLQVNFLAYSGGGQIAYSTAQEITGQAFVDNLVMYGSPFKARNGSSNIGHLWDIVGTKDTSYKSYWGFEAVKEWHRYNEGYTKEVICNTDPYGHMICSKGQREIYDKGHDLYSNSNVTRCDLIGEEHGLGLRNGTYDEKAKFGGIKCYGGGQDFEAPASDQLLIPAFANFLVDRVGIGKLK